jgi:hypothetical protein
VPTKEIAKSAHKPTEMIPNPEYDTWVAKDHLGCDLHHRGGSMESYPGHVYVAILWSHHQHSYGARHGTEGHVHDRGILWLHEVPGG